MSGDQLEIYLNDHLAGSTSGLELIRRIARSHSSRRREQFERIAEEIAEDRETLLELMRRLGTKERRPRQAVAWVLEKAVRLKPNGRLFTRAPLSNLLELEGMIMGVTGKLQLWRALAQLADRDPRLLPAEFDQLATRAENQRRLLEHVHREISQAALSSSG